MTLWEREVDRLRMESALVLPYMRPRPAAATRRDDLAGLDTAKADRFVIHLGHLIRGCPRSIL